MNGKEQQLKREKEKQLTKPDWLQFWCLITVLQPIKMSNAVNLLIPHEVVKVEVRIFARK